MRRSLERIVLAGIGLVSLSGVALVAALDVPVAVAASGSSPRVTLVSAGKSPRAPLRLALTSGTVTQATMELSESIKQTIDGTPNTSISIPPIDMAILSTVQSVTPEGNAHVGYSYDSVRVVDDGTMTADARANLESSLAPLTAVTTTSTVTDRNETKDAIVAGTEGLGASAAQLTEQLSDQFGALSVTFPTEPVGLGARWREASTTTLSGVKVTQNFEYTLREHDGNRIGVGIKYLQTALPQRAHLPGVPAGAKVDITRYSVAGKGTASMDLSTLLPQGGTLHAAGTQAFHVRLQSDEGTISQKITIDVKIVPSPGVSS